MAATKIKKKDIISYGTIEQVAHHLSRYDGVGGVDPQTVTHLCHYQ
jgi:hypothetical protein